MPESTKPNKRADAIWKRLIQSYGDRFITAFGLEANDAWLAAIAEISNQRIAYGLKKVMRDSPVHPPTLPQFVSACADMPSQKPIIGPSLQEQLCAFVVLNCHPTIDQMRMPWTYCYRESSDEEMPKGFQRTAELLGVAIPADALREGFYISVLDMHADRQGHDRAMLSFRSGALPRKITSEVSP
jgi:hypothetical protein